MVERASEPGESSDIEADDKELPEVAAPATIDYASRPRPSPAPIGIFVASMLVSLPVSFIWAFFALIAIAFAWAAWKEQRANAIVLSLLPTGVSIATGGWLIYCVFVPGATYTRPERLAVRLGIVTALSIWMAIVVGIVMFGM
jgi:H+/gluconate symporter-like permease